MSWNLVQHLLQILVASLFSLNFWRTLVLFVRPIIPLFWTSSAVCLGFQSQGGSLTCVLCCVCAMNSSDSPLVRHLLIFWWPELQPSLLGALPFVKKDLAVQEQLFWKGKNTEITGAIKTLNQKWIVIAALTNTWMVRVATALPEIKQTVDKWVIGKYFKSILNSI